MNNSVFVEFDESIGDESSLWHDYKLEISASILEKFRKDEWAELQDIIFNRPQYWQERCAEAIGYLENFNGLDVLISFIGSPHMSVAAIAVS